MGSLATFQRLTAELGLAIGGRSLPPGSNLGASLLALRTRRGLGRRPVAALAGVSPTTLAALEAEGEGHLATTIRVAEALGVADIWMLRGRLSFGDGRQPAPFPSAIVVWSARDIPRAAMAEAFPDAWHVPRTEAVGDAG